MMSRVGPFLCVAVVTGAHGLKGWVKLKAFTEQPLELDQFGPVFDRDGERQFEIRALRAHKSAVVAKLSGIDDRTAAEGLKGVSLHMPRTALPELGDDDTWYHVDLIGMKAVDRSGGHVGEIVGVQNFGAGDLLEIEPASGGTTLFVPFSRTAVPVVDLPGGQVVLDSDPTVDTQQAAVPEKKRSRND